MNDDLDSKTDAEISEIFAVEVAGWRDADPTETREHYRSWIPPGKKPIRNCRYSERPAPFATSADAMLPWLEKHVAASMSYLPHANPGGWYASLSSVKVVAPTFARAACIALIRAKRATK